MPARQRAQQPDEWSGPAAGNPGGEARRRRRAGPRIIGVRRSRSPIRVAGTRGTKNPSLPGGGEGLSLYRTVAIPFRPSRKLNLSRWQVGLLARGFKRSDSTFSATLSLPRTGVRVAYSRLLPTYSGGTAPASHRTSLLCPKGTCSGRSGGQPSPQPQRYQRIPRVERLSTVVTSRGKQSYSKESQSRGRKSAVHVSIKPGTVRYSKEPRKPLRR